MDVLPFLAVTAMVVLVPGVDLALVTQQVLLRGRLAGLSAAAGIITGSALQALAAILGLSAILAASEGLFLAVKLAGAGYLIWLGGQALWRAWHAPASDQPRRTARDQPRRTARDQSRPSGRDQDPEARAQASDAATVNGWRSFRAGLLTNLLNPKIIVFYVTFLPQFVGPGPGAAVRTGLLALIFLTVAACWLLIYTAVLQRLRAVLTRPRVQRRIEQITGAVLVGLGVRLALER